MVVSLTDAVNNPIKLPKPSVDVANWRSMGGGGGLHRSDDDVVRITFEGMESILRGVNSAH
jgi:hypothetical protein